MSQRQDEGEVASTEPDTRDLTAPAAFPRASSRADLDRPRLTRHERRQVRRDPATTPIVPDLYELKADHAQHVERIRYLALRIRSAMRERELKCVAVVSAMPNEGKTTTACNIALAMASMSPPQTIALLEFDLRKPTISGQLDLHPTIGIDSVLSGEAPLQDACCTLEYPALDVYPAITPQRMPFDLFTGPYYHGVMAELESWYQMVVIDTPPALKVSDASFIIGDRVAAVSVARAGVTKTGRYQELHERLPQAAMVGQVLNQSEVPLRPLDYYYYSRSDPSD